MKFQNKTQKQTRTYMYMELSVKKLKLIDKWINKELKEILQKLIR